MTLREARALRPHLPDMGAAMPTPAEWREEARLYRYLAEKESMQAIKQRLASHALALALLAERIERTESARKETAT